MKKSTTPAKEFFSHVKELRGHIIRSLKWYLVFLFPLAVFSKSLFNLIATPMLSVLGSGNTLISTQIVGTVFVPLKLAMFVALLTAAPFIIYEIWRFIIPGLYPNEIKRTRPILFLAIMCFYVGCAFAFFIAMPLMLAYFNAVTPEGVQYIPDIASYFDFIFLMFFAFGIVFEVPVVCYLLLKLKIITFSNLITARPYFIITTAVITAIITPPDALSMLLVLIPMILLFELSLFILKFTMKNDT